MNSFMIYVPIIMAIIGLAFMLYKQAWVLKQDAGDGKMKEISDYIKSDSGFRCTGKISRCHAHA